MRTVGNSIAVKPFEEESTTKSGIIIPFSVVSSTMISGKVLSVGNKVKTINAGDIVYYRKTLEPIEHEGNIILSESEVTAVDNGM